MAAIRRLPLFASLTFALLAALATPRPALAATDPLLGEIMFVGYNFCPRGWTEANGQLLSIASNSALFSLYGTTYGGDGRTTFALPDLRGRAPVHAGQGPGLSNYNLGQKVGSESTTLTAGQLPAHTHGVSGVTATQNVNTAEATTAAPEGKVLADGQRAAIYADTPASVDDEGTLGADSISLSGSTDSTGSGQAIDNRQPVLTIRACVALVGTFPSRN